MNVVILAGGYGTRLAEYTDRIPKPMVRIGELPILVHIMQIYAKHGHTDFYIALGYKGEVIKEYFRVNNQFSDWTINLIDTGEETLTGGRLKKLQDYLKNETFFLTYGDGLSDVNPGHLLEFHRSNKKLITLTAVRPPARFGELELKGNSVVSFDEKPQMQKGWINGGFFVIEPEFIDFIDNDLSMLEREPMQEALSKGELIAYKHDGFWQCMDTKREHEALTILWDEGNPPWKKD